MTPTAVTAASLVVTFMVDLRLVIRAGVEDPIAATMAATVRSSAAGSATARGSRAACNSAAVPASAAGASSGATAPRSMRSAVSASRSLFRIIDEVMAREAIGVTLLGNKFSGEANQGPVLQGADSARPLSHDRRHVLDGTVGPVSQADHLGLG